MHCTVGAGVVSTACTVIRLPEIVTTRRTPAPPSIAALQHLVCLLLVLLLKLDQFSLRVERVNVGMRCTVFYGFVDLYVLYCQATLGSSRKMVTTLSSNLRGSFE